MTSMQKIVAALGAVVLWGSASAATREEGAAIAAMWWAKSTAWEQHLLNSMHELFVCQASEPANDRSPCNFLAGHVLSDVFGIDDFKSANGFLTADQMVSKVYTSQSLWKEIGTAADQANLKEAEDKANGGYAVIALYPSINGHPGHVVIILPGELLHSTSWGLDVPNSASFFLDDPARSYVGKGLSSAFGPTKKGDVRLFFRVGSNIHT